MVYTDDFTSDAPFPDSTRTDNTISQHGEIRGLRIHAGASLEVRDISESLPISIYDELTIADDGSLELFLDGRNWGSRITVDSSVSPQLGGTLQIAISDIHIEELVGTTFELFDWGTTLAPANAFGQVQVPPGSQWDLSQLYSAGAVTLVSVPEPSSVVSALVTIIGGAIVLRRNVR